jgi:hypothetical protein
MVGNPLKSLLTKMKLGIFLISQSKERGYDTYDSAVVAAESPEDAVTIYPSELSCNFYDHILGQWYTEWKGERSYRVSGGSWAQYSKDVSAELIGRAAPLVKRGVICSSFNAG